MSNRLSRSPGRSPMACAVAIAASMLFSSATPAAEPVTVVPFGDSTTAPRDNLTVYSAMLQEELRNVNIINASIAGEWGRLIQSHFLRTSGAGASTKRRTRDRSIMRPCLAARAFLEGSGLVR